jgi:hypothetical protein
MYGPRSRACTLVWKLPEVDLPRLRGAMRAVDYFAKSATGAVGPLVFTDLMPFSIADVDLYISLLPMTSPLAALRTK